MHLEVKLSENTKAKSLNVYIDTYKPAYAVKLSTKILALKMVKNQFPFTLHSVCSLILSGCPE